MSNDLEALKEAIRRTGSASELARRLGVTPAAVLQWSKVPANRVLLVERESGVSRYELRPDVFGEQPERASR